MHKIKTVQPDWSLSVKSFWYKNDWKAKLYNVQVGYTSSGQHNQCPQGMEKKKKSYSEELLFWVVRKKYIIKGNFTITTYFQK